MQSSSAGAGLPLDRLRNRFDWPSGAPIPSSNTCATYPHHHTTQHTHIRTHLDERRAAAELVDIVRGDMDAARKRVERAVVCVVGFEERREIDQYIVFVSQSIDRSIQLPTPNKKARLDSLDLA